MTQMQEEAVHRLTWPDVFAGRAEVQIGPESMVRLAKRAGAPWNEWDPDAVLSPLQLEVITAPERVLCLFGGSRGGKSIVGACIGLGQLMIPNARIALIGASYEHCSKEFGYIWKGFFKLFPRSAATEAQFITRQPHYSMRLSTVWGSTVQVYSITAKEGGQILGSEFDLVILCEAAQVPPDIFTNKVERALLGRAKRRAGEGYLRRTGRALLLTTPKQQTGASYDLYHRAMSRTRGKLEELQLDHGAPWFDSFRFWQADVRELNPSYPVEAFEAARRTLPRRDFEEQFLGKAIVRSGLVYSSFGDRHVIKREQLPALDVLRRSHWGVGIDTGENYAAVLACLTPEGHCYIVGETRETGGNTQEKSAATLAMIQEKLEGIFPDPKGAIEHWVVDVNSQHKEDLEMFLDVVFFAQKYDVNDSIGHLDIRYGQGQIFIVDECEFLLHEIRGFRYRKQKYETGRQKDKFTGENHLLDAKRYLLMHLFDMGPPPPDPVAVTFEEMMAKSREDMLTPNLARDLESLRNRQMQEVLGGRW